MTTTTTTARILVAEQDEATRLFLADNLTADGYHVETATTEQQAKSLLDNQVFDLLVADVNGHTLSVVEHAAGLCSILVLSSNPSALDACRKLDRGADDYQPKPFSYPELRSRVGALLRRREATVTGARPERLRVGGLEIDPSGRDVHLDGRLLDLQAKEYALLIMLAGEPTRVFTKEEILRKVWGYKTPGSTRTLDSHACRLRQKLKYASGERLIVNVWGVGYRLIDADRSTETAQTVPAPAVVA